jgi:hypothetical protein
MDPYAYIEYRGKRYKTTILDEGGKNPEWHQDLTVPVVSFSDIVILGCNEQDLLIDDEVGAIKFPMY